MRTKTPLTDLLFHPEKWEEEVAQESLKQGIAIVAISFLRGTLSDDGMNLERLDEERMRARALGALRAARIFLEELGRSFPEEAS